MENKKNNLIKKTGKIFLALALSVMILGLAKTATAQQETSGNIRILYQGILSNSEGLPVADGTYNMKFEIFDQEQGGNSLWEEEHAFYENVLVRDGKFKIILGRKSAITLNFNQPSYWLSIKIGELKSGSIIWNEEIKPRKKIVSLSQILKEEGMEDLEEGGIDEGEWNTIFDLLERKMEKQPDLVVLLNIGEILNNTSDSFGGSDSKLGAVLKTLINFISEKISQIFEELALIREKIESISETIERMGSLLANISFKIDVLYKVLVQDKGLVPDNFVSQELGKTYYQNKKTERMVFKAGEDSLRILNQSVQQNSLIFISFSENPESSWWISEKIPGYSFNISLGSPAKKDLIFDYWILNEEESADSFQGQGNQNIKPQEETIQESEEETTQNQTEGQVPLIPEGLIIQESSTSQEAENSGLETKEEVLEDLLIEETQQGVLPEKETEVENQEQ